MKFFTSIVVLAVSVANAMETEDCCEVPSGSPCPVGGYPIQTTAGGKLRKLAASDDTTCCKTEGFASEFNLGTDPIPTCAALAASDVNVLNEDDQGEDETTVGSSGASSCCKTSEATCPEDAPMSVGTKMSHEICCTTDNPGPYIFDWLVVCGEEGSVQVMDVNGEGDDQGEDEDETTTTTTSGAATDCCTTTDSTCPSGKTNIDADTMVSGVMVETCCASDGNLEIKNMNLKTLDPCTGTATVDETGDNSAPAERVTIAIGMVLVGATMLQ